MKEYVKYIQKLSIKKDDVLLLILPREEMLSNKRIKNISDFITIFEKLLPYKNKVAVIPDNVKLKVIEKDDQKLLGEDWYV